jgi:LysR family tcuABC transcriptional regulator
MIEGETVELRQLRYFVRVVEVGSMGRAAKTLGVGTSALSQQVSRLESELSTRLLKRSASGVRATDAGVAFYKQAQLSLRHADDAIRAAQQARLSGHVSVGMAPSTSAVLALPFIAAMRQRYPDIHLRLVEALSGSLSAMLNGRQLDLAMLFDIGSALRWSVAPVLDERLFVIGLRGMTELRKEASSRSVTLARLAGVPLVLPSRLHGLRAIVDSAFARVRVTPRIVLEVDGLATNQPGAAVARSPGDAFANIAIADSDARRVNMLASLSEDELSPAALAARVVLRDVAARLVAEGRWPGATVHES